MSNKNQLLSTCGEKSPQGLGEPGCPPAEAGRQDVRELAVQNILSAYPRLAISIPEASKLLGISKNLVYKLANRPDFPTLTLGGRKVVSVLGLLDWIQQQVSDMQKGRE